MEKYKILKDGGGGLPRAHTGQISSRYKLQTSKAIVHWRNTAKFLLNQHQQYVECRPDFVQLAKTQTQHSSVCVTLWHIKCCNTKLEQ